MFPKCRYIAVKLNNIRQDIILLKILKSLLLFLQIQDRLNEEETIFFSRKDARSFMRHLIGISALTGV